MAKTDITYRATLDPQGVKEGANAVNGEFNKLNDSFKGVAAACKKYNDTMANGSTGNLRKELRATLQAAASLENEYRKLSAAEKASAQGQELRAKIDELIQKGGELRDTMGDVNSAITRVASDTAQIDAAVGALSALNAVAEVGIGAFAMLGVEEGKLEQVQKDLMAVIAIGNGLQTIQNALQKESAVMMWANAVKTSVLTAATKGDTIVQTAWNVAKAVGKAMLGDFTGLLIVGAGAFLTYKVATADSAEELDNHKKSVEDDRRALNELNEQTASTTGELVGKYKQLQAQWIACNGDAKRQAEMLKKNENAMKDLGLSVHSLVDAENVFVKNTPNVEASLIKRAKAMAAMNQIVENEKKRFEELNKADERTYGGTKRRVWKSGQEVGSDKFKEFGLTWEQAKERGYVKSTEFRDPMYGVSSYTNTLTAQGVAFLNMKEGAKSAKAYGDEVKRINDIYDQSNKRALKQLESNADALGGGSSSSTTTRTSSGGTNRSTGGGTTPIVYKEGSLGYIDNQLKELKDKLQQATSNKSRNEIYKQISALESQRVELVFASKNGKTPMEAIRELMEKDVAAKPLPVPELEVDASKIKEIMKNVFAYIDEYKAKLKEVKQDTMFKSINNLSSAFSSLGEIIGGVAGQMVSWAAQSAASIAQMLAENAQLIISAQAVAMANGAKSAFALPFPFNLAAWASVAATIAGIFASLPKFATGGIVSGSGYSGDRQLIRANSGEMVITRAQQARLWSAISGGGSLGGGQVTFKISGQELHGVLRNYNNKINRAR